MENEKAAELEHHQDALRKQNEHTKKRKSNNNRGERRVSPSMYKFLLALHIIVSVGWLGTAYAKFILQLAAMMTNDPDISIAIYSTMKNLSIAFPILAIPTIITGVLLSLSTKWGLIKYYWVVTKFVLSVGVIVTAISLDGRFIEQSISALSGQAMDKSMVASAPSILLISLTVAHLIMLGAATFISVYKPWGKTWFDRRKS
jgi:cation transport ATPase